MTALTYLAAAVGAFSFAWWLMPAQGPGCDLDAHFPGVHWISMEADQ